MCACGHSVCVPPVFPPSPQVDKFLAEFAAVPLDSLPADEALRLVTALVDANAAVLARAVGLPA